MMQLTAPAPTQAGPPRLWGLDARRLHDAFWAARGVQCVRRGESVELQPAAELYLLVEPDLLVAFDLSLLTDRLLWHDAAVTRLRLIDEHADPYLERVVCDERGLVRRIERRYRGSAYGSHRVILTTRRKVASIWMAAPSPVEGWRRVRRSVPWSRVDHWKLTGTVLREDDAAQQRRFITDLVARWSSPDQSIHGIRQSGPGVWHGAGETLEEGVVRVGPLWLGRGDCGSGGRPCLVGPDWVEDDATAGETPRATVRPIAEVSLPEETPSGARNGDQLYPLLKRAMDAGVSALTLLVLLPVLAAVALLIVLEDGRPVFFGHRRQGRGGRVFPCWKFRTMHRDAERMARELQEYNVCDGPQVYIQDDPRVTRIGRVLRRSHLDELPQLWNVLLGQMSLVGPRPSPDDENQFCPAWRDSRLSVRPGMTGLWQLRRTREPGEDFQEWIRYDMEYVRNASLWLDLKILAQTARIVFLGRDDRADDQAG